MKPKMKPQFLIAAAGSNSGKTTLTMGLLRALSQRGLCVQPYKCGPDYIDPKYHALAAGRESVNLDTWLASPMHIRELYYRYGRDADVLVAEGVMGMFDGYRKMEGSSAEIARLLGLPVVLVVNARSTAYSVAPLIYGFKHFCPEVEIAGVIFNQIASEKHYDNLRQACLDADVVCLGALPRMKEVELPSRHLGLTLDSRYLMDRLSLRVAEEVERHIDVTKLLNLCSRPFKAESFQPLPPVFTGNMRIAVARDEAFNFTYRRNIERLQEAGEVCFFSPMSDASLPEADMVYLPGGYPELYLQALSNNESMRQSVRLYAEAGKKILAECGGMMYLCNYIIGMDGKRYPMTGVLPLEATMEGMRLHIGYRTFVLNGESYKGHEFHYSSVKEIGVPLSSVALQHNAQGESVSTPLYRYKNVVAGYTHLYWGESSLSTLWSE